LALNERDGLIDGRRTTYQRVRERFGTLTTLIQNEAYEQAKKLFDQLMEEREGRKPYTFAARQAFRDAKPDFEKYVFPLLGP
jgi:hypothetical protein